MNESSEANELPDPSADLASQRDDDAAAAPADAPSAPEPAPMPGRFLREAREARGLTVYEVAQSLKFGVRQIEALEADDYEALPPGATFQRGFVRGYAKLLKLDAAPLLAMLDAEVPVVPADVRAPQNMGVAASPVVAGSRSSRPMLYGSALLAVVAIGMAVWHFGGGPSEPRHAAPAAPVTTPADAGMRAPDIRVEQTPASEGQGQAPTGATPADMHQLVFVFQDKSWVEVTDATQRIIFSAENAAGTRQAVTGKPPFQIVIGNAAKVELQYDDRQIDLKPYTRAEVARLTLE